MTDRQIIIPDNTVVLKNRGFRIKVHRLERDEQSGKLVRVILNEETGEPVLDDYWFKFTNLSLAQIEEQDPAGWGSLDAWSEALQASPFRNIARTFAIVFDEFVTTPDMVNVPDVKFGALVIPDDMVTDYVMVMMAALQLAQGVDPKACAEMAVAGLKEAADKRMELTGVIFKAINEVNAGSDTPTSQIENSTSDTSSEDGQQSIDPGTSSGS